MGTEPADGFVMGNDRGLWHQAFDGQKWSGWETMHGGEMRSKPAAVCWGPNRIDLFAVGRNHDLMHAAWDGARWGGWTPRRLPHQPTDRCQLGTEPPGRVRPRHRRRLMAPLVGRSRVGRELLGGSIVGQPEAVCWGPNRIDVFAVGPGGDMQHLWYENRWGPWESLGGVLPRSAPTPVSWGPNRLDVFAIGTDLGARGTDGGMARPGRLGSPLGGGPLASRAAAVSWGPNRLDVFARRATDQALGHLWYENRWGPWESLGGFLLSG